MRLTPPPPPSTESTPLISSDSASCFTLNVFYLNALRVLLQNIWYLKWAAGPNSVVPHLKHELSSTQKTIYNVAGMLSFFLMDSLITLVQYSRLKKRRIEARLDEVRTGTPVPSGLSNMHQQEVLRDEKNTYVHFAYMAFRPLVAIGYFLLKESDELTIVFFNVLASFALMSNAFSFYKYRKDVKDLELMISSQVQDLIEPALQHRHVKMQSAGLNLGFSVVSSVATALWASYPGECGVEFFMMNIIQLAANYFYDAKVREKDAVFRDSLKGKGSFLAL